MDTKIPGSSTPNLLTARAGGSLRKSFAYSSLSPAKSSGLASSTSTSTTSSKLAPAAFKVLSQFRTACRVCSWMVEPAGFEYRIVWIE